MIKLYQHKNQLVSRRELSRNTRGFKIIKKLRKFIQKKLVQKNSLDESTFLMGILMSKYMYRAHRVKNPVVKFEQICAFSRNSHHVLIN